MKIRITPKPLAGQISAIPSKSHGHRLLICAALGGAPEDALVDIDSEDIHATRDCLAALLAPSTKDAPTPILPCRESGSTLRFLLPLALCCREKVTFTMKGRLPHRPLSPLKEELEAHGCCFSPLNQNGALTQLTLSGKLQGGTFSLPGNVSSQFITGLLFALPLLPEGGKIQITTPLESKPYLDLTLKVLSTFGIEIQEQDNAYLVPGNQRYCSPGKQRAEGDWSNLAFWITANALGSSITYTGGDLHSAQGDKAILSLLSSREIDGRQVPDLLPILAAKAAVTPGTTRFIHAERLRLKESDRLRAICQNINALGGCCRETTDGLILEGRSLTGGTVEGYNDHRIVMAMAILATVCNDPVTIVGGEAVNKSYPDFFNDYRLLGGDVIEV